jgi:hypothetical protein
MYFVGFQPPVKQGRGEEKIRNRAERIIGV